MSCVYTLNLRPAKSIILSAMIFSASLAHAQNVKSPDSLVSQHEKSTSILDEIRKDISVNTQQEAQLSKEISALNADRTTLNRKLITATAKSRSLEVKIQRSSVKVLELEENRRSLRKSLSGRKALLAEVLAALQRMGKNPPPALLVTPKDALKSVRSAILLGSVVPEIRAETEILVAELSQLVTLSAQIDTQRDQLAIDLQTEAKEEKRLSLLIQEKKKFSIQAREKLASQGIKAVELAAKATNLTTLITKLETEIEAVNLANQAAKKAEEERQKRQNDQIASAREEISRPDFSDTSRISPAVKFTKARGHLIKPVNGVEIRKFGDADELGDPSPSMAIATRVNARVISPADGWVVYSGPFRSYGQLLILNVGSNHHIVMSGMQKVDVELGQFVLVGEPLGLMGANRIANAATKELGLSRPVLTIEFRENSEPINPAPWWQTNTDKRSNDAS